MGKKNKKWENPEKIGKTHQKKYGNFCSKSGKTPKKKKRKLPKNGKTTPKSRENRPPKKQENPSKNWENPKKRGKKPKINREKKSPKTGKAQNLGKSSQNPKFSPKFSWKKKLQARKNLGISTPIYFYSWKWERIPALRQFPRLINELIPN